jgi:hypothetical protein
MLQSLATSSSSDEEEDRNHRSFRAQKNRIHPFEIFDDQEFKMRFRFEKQTILWLCDLIGPDLEPATQRRKSISALNKILLTMRCFATGAFQQIVGDTLAVHKSTACIMQHIVHKIAELKPQYIKMPSAEELQMVKLNFYRLGRMPRVIGAIDCTHVRINSPGGPDAETYRNRKSFFFSINVQADLKI